MTSTRPLLLVAACLTLAPVGCAPTPRPDPAAWQQWVHDEVRDGPTGTPAWQQPGVQAAVIQFGYDYRDRRDRQNLGAAGIDHRLVAEMREDLIRKGVPVNSSNGVAWVDVAAEKARNFLCPEDVPPRLRPNVLPFESWVVGSVLGAFVVILVVWLALRRGGGPTPPQADAKPQ